MNQSGTPRTDAEECEAITGLGRCVGVNFSRELERENARLRERLEKMTAAAEAQAKIMESIGMGAQRRAARQLLSDLPNDKDQRRPAEGSR